jgi:hypothetical protein
MGLMTLGTPGSKLVNLSIVLFRSILLLKIYKSPELFHKRGKILNSQDHKFINHILNKGELSQQWRQSVIIPVYKRANKTDFLNFRGISLLSLHAECYPVLEQVFCLSSDPAEWNANAMEQWRSYLQISKELEVRREVLYSILIELNNLD